MKMLKKTLDLTNTQDYGPLNLTQRECQHSILEQYLTCFQGGNMYFTGSGKLIPKKNQSQIGAYNNHGYFVQHGCGGGYGCGHGHGGQRGGGLNGVMGEQNVEQT